MQQEQIVTREAKCTTTDKKACREQMDILDERIIIGELYQQQKQEKLKFVATTDVRGEYVCTKTNGDNFKAFFVGSANGNMPCVFFCIPNKDKVFYEGYAIVISKDEKRQRGESDIIQKIIPLVEEESLKSGAQMFQL